MDEKNLKLRNGRVLRILAIIPTLLSGTAFILQLVAILSGNNPSQLDNFMLMSVITSSPAPFLEVY